MSRYSTDCETDARIFGRVDEWHLEFDNALGHRTFEFGAGLHHPIVVSPPALLDAGFEPIRSISHAMSGDGVKQVLVQQ